MNGIEKLDMGCALVQVIALVGITCGLSCPHKNTRVFIFIATATIIAAGLVFFTIPAGEIAEGRWEYRLAQHGDGSSSWELRAKAANP